MHCETCVNVALNDCRFCNACMTTRFGPHVRTKLPRDVLQQVFEFCSSDVLDLLFFSSGWSNGPKETFANFYFVHQYFKPVVESYSMLFQHALYYQWDKQLLVFLATRCSMSSTFWNNIIFCIHLLLQHCHFDIIELCLPSQLNQVTDEMWIERAYQAKTDAVQWWLFDFRPLVTQFENVDDLLQLLNLCRNWNSERVTRRLIENGVLIQHPSAIEFALSSAVRLKQSFVLFETLWNMKSNKLENIASLIASAILSRYTEVLDVLRTCDVSFYPYQHALRQCDAATFRAWMIQNNFITAECWNHDAFYELPNNVIMELIVYVLQPMDQTMQNKTLRNTQLLEMLIQNTNRFVLDWLCETYHITSFATEQKRCATMTHMCKHFNPDTIMKYIDFLTPCTHAECLCTWLCTACRWKQHATVVWLLDKYATCSLDQTFYPMTFDDTKMTLDYFLKLVKQNDLVLAQKLFRLALVFDMLRKQERTFLLNIPYETLVWYSNLRDYRGDQIRIRDIRVSHNTLLRIAHRKKDSNFQTWLWNFVDQYGCTLKSGDKRDLRRG